MNLIVDNKKEPISCSTLEKAQIAFKDVVNVHGIDAALDMSDEALARYLVYCLLALAKANEK